MPFGRVTCLPRGWLPASVGSHTRTTSSPPPSLSESVTSTLNGSLPPLWVTSSSPSIHTVACQSTAPKCSSTRLPVQPAGTATVRRYHSACSAVGCLPTPDSALSAANGTRILPSHFSGLLAVLAVMAYSQRPFRFCQSARTSCGRGYSGQAFVGVTCLPHLVISGAGAGCQSGGAARAAASRERNTAGLRRGI